MAQKDPNIPLSGMTNAHPMNVKENQYPFMLNGNIQTDINGAITLTNEHSNVLCVGFESGYKVIGHIFVPEDNVTFLFLVNPSTGGNLIGYINEYVLVEFTDKPREDNCDECGTINVENTPLEEQPQVPTCTFTCITRANCLLFDINFPIKGVFKRDNCGDTIYFTDFNNPIRALKLDSNKEIDNSIRAIDHYTANCEDGQENFDTCEEATEAGCTCCEPVYKDRCAVDDLDCIKLRLFPEVAHVCIEPHSVNPGGSLQAGTYQLAVCYADVNGQRATRTFSCSNPVSVFDPSQTVTDQLDYTTDLSVKFLIKDLDASIYKYIDVFVVATINRVSAVKQYSTIEISSLVDGTLEYVVSDFEKGKDVTIDDILQIFPVYDKAQLIATAGNTLLLGNLVSPRDLNIQRAVNNLSPFIKWQTIEVDEDFYLNGANGANYRGYLRDELYAFGIVFERNNTLDTCAYPLIGRAKNVVVDPDCITGFFYAGNWLPTGYDYPNNLDYPDKVIVSIGNSVYVNNTGGVIGAAVDPRAGAPWTVVTAANAATFCILPDDDVISNNDVFDFPSCDTPFDGSLRWRVYNTALNLGTLCNYSPSGVSCVQKFDKFPCYSYSYTASSLIIENLVGAFQVGDLITGSASGATATVLIVTNQTGSTPYLILDTTTVVGTFTDLDSITGSISGATADVVSFTLGEATPFDCFVGDDYTAVNCEDVYPTPYDDPSIEPADTSCTNGECCPNEDPAPKQDDPCQDMGTTLVRSQTDAAGAGVNALCIDAQLASYPTTLSIPYAYKLGQSVQEVSKLETRPYFVYPTIQSLIDGVPTPPNPTPSLGGTPRDICVEFTADNNGTWLWTETYSGVSINYNFPSAVQIPNVASTDQGCVEYNSNTQATINTLDSIRFFFGNNLGAWTNPGCTPCNGCTDQYCDCTVNAADYWGIGASTFLDNDKNVTPFQSRWYKIQAQTPTLMIKMKIGCPDSGAYTFGQYDIRIDVYDSLPGPGIQPKWSSGEDTSGNPASAFYSGGTDEDNGILIIGDVANSIQKYAGPGATNPVTDLPLIQNNVYYIHCYMLPSAYGGNLETYLNSAPVDNPLHDSQSDEGYEDCPCYLPPYAWANLCVDYPSSSTTKDITTPAITRLQCEFEIAYRIEEVIDSGCDGQTFETGEFGYFEALTKKYPGDSIVWGDLCNLPIRHFKMPDVLVSYLQDENPTVSANPGRKAKAYPLGISIDPEQVKRWLQWAEDTGLITREERLGITGYKIVRANRVGNKSIVGKGLLWDMWKYNEYDWFKSKYSTVPTFFPSYGFNDLREDPFLVLGDNKTSSVHLKHPFQGQSNNRFAWLSPETTFNGPTIGPELKFESINFGDSIGKYYEVTNHPKYVLLSGDGIILVTVLAAFQLAADLLILIAQLLGNYTVGFAFTVPVGSIIGIVGSAINVIPNFFIYAKKWREIVLGFGVPKNFANYYAAVGNYHSSGLSGVIPNLGNKRRLINNSSYLLAGNMSLSDSGSFIRINNYLREDSVYLSLNLNVDYNSTDSPIFTNRPDNSKYLLSSDYDGNACTRIERIANVLSIYASVKYSVPDQYGSIHDIDWLYTGKCESIQWGDDQEDTCTPIFGGDTYISRMTQKRKFPFFVANAVGVQTGVDFQYYHLSNVTSARYFFNSVGESALSASSIQFAPVEHVFDSCDNDGGMYLKGPMYLFYYGIVSFLCESDFNLNYRYAEDTSARDFYPHQSDIENWTQEYKIPISTPNAYLINRTYLKQNKENFFCTQPAIYSNDTCITTYRNRVANSIPDADSDFYTDPWRVFLANDYADFPLTNGQLIGMDGIEREKVLLRFLNTSLVFNAYYTMTTDAGVAQIGTASMFAQKPLEYAKTEVGYGGTQHEAFVSTQFGHFWVDAKRSAVFMLPPDSGLVEISQSFSTFFNNNLPFFILKAFPTYPVDNSYKGVGITLGWDNKFDRLFLTKLDFELKGKYFQSVSPNNYVEYVQDVESGEFVFRHCVDDGLTVECTIIELTDEEFFCNKSWTISYSPVTKTWISFHSFVPNFYIGHENYFQTGINYPQSGDTAEIGIWNHLITNKSYQVYYGKLYPYITDIVTKEQLVNKQLQSIEYQTDFLRFQNDYDYFYNPRVTFNKMVIWAENRNTGNLELVPQIPNNMAQSLLYPQSNPDSTSVLVARKENSWRVNQFWDLVRNKFSNVPPMVYNCHPYMKEVNPLAINYFKPTFERNRMTSDYFTIRFINDIYSNYKIINKWFLNNTIQSIT